MNRQIEEWKREITKPLPPDPTAAFIEVFARAGIVVMVLAPVAMVVVVLIIAASR